MTFPDLPCFSCKILFGPLSYITKQGDSFTVLINFSLKKSSKSIMNKAAALHFPHARFFHYYAMVHKGVKPTPPF